VVVERLLTLDDTDRSYTYLILESPFLRREQPQRHLRRGVYGTGLAALQQRFG